MSSEISTPASEPVTCPYCTDSRYVVPMYTGGPVFDYYNCNQCQIPFVTKVELIRKVTVHKIEGIEPVVKAPIELVKCDDVKDFPTMVEVQKEIEENTHTCTECKCSFVSSNPHHCAGKIICDECNYEIFRHGGSQPEPDRFLCAWCGTLNDASVQYESDDGLKICATCNDQKDRTWTDAPVEYEPPEDEPEYIPLPDSKTVSYCIEGDTIKLQYKGSDCNSYSSDVIWDIVDSPQSDWMSSIDKMLEGEKNHIQKASALNQLCKAVDKGTVKIPGSDD